MRTPTFVGNQSIIARGRQWNELFNLRPLKWLLQENCEKEEWNELNKYQCVICFCFFHLFSFVPIFVRSLTTSCNGTAPELFLSNILVNRSKYWRIAWLENYRNASIKSLCVMGLLICLLIICRNLGLRFRYV